MTCPRLLAGGSDRCDNRPGDTTKLTHGNADVLLNLKVAAGQEGDMRRLLSILSIALAALWVAVGSAHAQKGTRGAEQANSAYIECFKQHGAAYDSASKKWTLNTTELHSTNLLDAIRELHLAPHGHAAKRDCDS